MADRDSLIRALQSFARAMGGSYDVNEMAEELTHSVKDVLDASGAGVSVADTDGNLRFVAASPETIVAIERQQEKTQDGPCVDAFRSSQMVGTDDLRDDDRWPDYSRVATEMGIRTVIGYPLVYDDWSIGSVNVYFTDPSELTEDDSEVLGVIADMATAYLARMSELTEATRLNEQLQHALESRIIIEQAKGKLAGEYDISVDEAFELLRRHARSNNVKLADLCDAIVNKGLDLPVRS